MSTDTITDVFAELSEDGKRVEVYFSFSKAAVEAIKRVPGRNFVAKDKGGPKWTLPMDLTSMRMLREEFGAHLTLGEAVKAWGKDATAKERSLRSLSQADDAELERLAKRYPDLAKYLRPYQRADAAFMATANAINANHMGLGKTVEIIAAILEAGLEDGPHLVIGPKTSLETVWLAELDKWLPEDVSVFVISGDDTPKERAAAVDEFCALADEGEPCWMVTNAHMIRFVTNPEWKERMAKAAGKGRGDRPEDYEGDTTAEDAVAAEIPELIPAYPQLFEVEYNTFTVDEYHKTGLSNPKSKMHAAVREVKAQRTILTSGTPMGGKPEKLWAALNVLYPEQYTSKWRWVDQWLETEEEETRRGTFKKILGISPGKEDAFWDALSPHLVRRTKKEVVKDLPDKQIIDIWVPMTKRQQKQYNAMALDAEVKIENENLSATGILAEYMRLKQFAGAHQRIRELPFVMDKLGELGISGDPEEQEGNDKIVIASQFSSLVDMYHEHMVEQGITALKITGDVNKKGERTRLQNEFRDPEGPRVMIVTTTAGGVSVNFDVADTMIILDETWDPDDQEQMEDRSWWRGDSERANLTVYYVRSKDSIEEYIQQVAIGKAITNKEILDLRRAGFRAIKQ
jgi:SNF2 family DNA or RNA helicase